MSFQSQSIEQVAPFDPYQQSTAEDPFPVYRRLREHAPVLHNSRLGFWTLALHDDVVAASRDWRTFSSGRGIFLDQTNDLWGPNFLNMDPPRHDALRELMRSHFSPRSIAALEPMVQVKVEQLLDRLGDRRSAEFVQEFTYALPNFVICEMLGIPADDHDEFADHFRTLMGRPPGDATIPDDAWRRREHLRGYFSELMERRRRHPEADLVTTVVAAKDAGRMSEEEAMGTCFLLFVAGVQTTSSLIATSLMYLADHPEQRAWLADDPSRAPRAIEELVRYDGPAQWLGRFTTAEVRIRDAVIPANERVLLLFGSANRDERAFPDSETLDIRREPKRHLGFGEGIHFCLGAPLARLEAKIALPAVLKRMPDYWVDRPVAWSRLPGEHRPLSMHVAW